MDKLNASNEQQQIITQIQTKNIVVQAAAGSGKTTTICFMAKKYPNKRFLVLTYNKRLKFETREKIVSFGLTNVDVQNYHSFCCSKYNVQGYTDEIIKSSLEMYSTGHLQYNPYSYDVIVIDEAQDLTDLYFKLVNMIFEQNILKNQCKLCVIGDINQTIYGFNGADERFMKYANTIFKSNGSWILLPLTTSYRLSQKMCDFINNCTMWNSGQPKINSGVTTSSGYRPRYLFCDAFSPELTREITQYYLGKKEFGYTFDDIFVLAPSIQSENSPVKMFSNYLSLESGIPVYVPTSDEERLDINDIKGKIVFATFHQVKGLERKCIIVFGADSSYFYYYNPDVDRSKCPNEFHVAFTRTSERMTVVHHYRKDFLNFINNSLIEQYCYTEKVCSTLIHDEWFVREYKCTADPELLNKRIFNRIKSGKERFVDKVLRTVSEYGSINKVPQLSVTRLLKGIHNDVLVKCLKMLTITHYINTKNNLSEADAEDTDESLILSENHDICNLGIGEQVVTEYRRNDKFIISLQTKVTQKNFGLLENISEVIGTAIPILYEYHTTQKLDIINSINSVLNSTKNKRNDIFRTIRPRFKELIKMKEFKSDHIFELVTMHQATSNNVIHKINQIGNYKFITQPVVKQCYRRFSNNLHGNPSNYRYEQYVDATFSREIDGIEISRVIYGYIDCIDERSLWEFKTRSVLTEQNIIQLVIYMYLYRRSTGQDKECHVLSICSGDKYKIEGTNDVLEKIMQTLFVSKFAKKEKLTDRQFLKKFITDTRV